MASCRVKSRQELAASVILLGLTISYNFSFTISAFQLKNILIFKCGEKVYLFCHITAYHPPSREFL